MPRRLTANDIELVLKKHGFECISQKGSHRKWRNSDNGLVTIVPYHGNRLLPIGTLFSIIRSSKIPKEEFGF